MLKYRRRKCAAICKKLPPLRAGAFWQREKDSNPHIRSQSPLCYLYTIPLCSDEQKLLYRFRGVCQQFFQKIRNLSAPRNLTGYSGGR